MCKYQSSKYTYVYACSMHTQGCRQTDRQTCRQTDRQTERIKTYIQIDEIHSHTYRWIGFRFFVNELTDGSIVEVVDVDPLDALVLVLLLLLFQNELDEELLQLLIAVVDAELLKAASRKQVHKVITTESYINFLILDELDSEK